MNIQQVQRNLHFERVLPFYGHFAVNLQVSRGIYHGLFSRKPSEMLENKFLPASFASMKEI